MLSRSLAHKQTNGQLRSGRVGNNHADWGYAFFWLQYIKDLYGGRLEHFYLAIVVVEPLKLDLGAGAKIDEKRSRITGTTKVAERLVMLLLRQLRQSLALDDDIADECLHDKVHLEEGLERLALVHRVVLEFLMGG